MQSLHGGNCRLTVVKAAEQTSKNRVELPFGVGVCVLRDARLVDFGLSEGKEGSIQKSFNLLLDI